MRDEIPIDDGIPVPDAPARGQPPIYPFLRLGVGQSFEVKDHQVASVRSLAIRFGQKHGREYVVRPYNGAFRCWRLR